MARLILEANRAAPAPLEQLERPRLGSFFRQRVTRFPSRSELVAPDPNDPPAAEAKDSPWSCLECHHAVAAVDP